jgi:hypothetical protein
MTAVYMVEAHQKGNATMLLCLVALGAIFLLVRSAFAQARGGARRQGAGSGPAQSMPRQSPAGVCQRCRGPLSVEAAYCGRCGMPVTRPTPIPLPRYRPRPGSSRWIAYVIIAVLGLIALGAYFPFFGFEPAPAPPVSQHAPSDAW